MLKVQIITVGKLKEKFFVDACAEYAKRLSRFISLQIVEIAEAPLPKDDSPALTAQALEKEAQAIQNAIPDAAYVVALCVEGKMIDSPALAAEIAALPQMGYSSLCFIVGSSCGLSPVIKKRAHRRLSFSPMTFPHQLMRVILLEQLYRAQKINSGEKYHK